MSCGCAARMRQYILPALGYELWEDRWAHPDGTMPTVSEDDVEHYYSRLTAQLVALRGEAVVKRWMNRILRLERAADGARSGQWRGQ